MALDRIILSHFRNHLETVLEETRAFNILIGENGAGKTNILEALSLLAPGRGLRRAKLSDMIGQGGGGGFTLAASLKEQGHESARLGTYIEPAQPSRRLVRINGMPAAAQSLAEWLALAWLTPAIDTLFSDGAGARRRFLDRMTLALEPSHARACSRYASAIRERNKLLEERSEARWLDAIEAQAAEQGALITQARSTVVARLAEELANLPDTPFARPLLTYRPGGPGDEDALRAALGEARARDKAAFRALTGPHRDELEVVMAGSGQAAAHCSTGEQKAMLIAITLAHGALAAQGRPSVLLLDEVAAHLDPVRRTALFERLRANRAQVWLTGTERAPFAEIAEEAAIWEVRGGAARRV